MFKSLAVTLKGSGYLLVGGAVATEHQVSGFENPLLSTNVIAITHMRSWDDESTEADSFSSSTYGGDEEICHVFYDSRNTGDLLTVYAKEDKTVVMASATVNNTNTTGCDDARFDAWECYRYQRFSVTGNGATTSGVMRYRPTRFEMDFSVIFPNLQDDGAAFASFTDTVWVGLSPTLKLNAELFGSVVDRAGTVSFEAGTVWATRGAATTRNGLRVTPAFTVCHSGEMVIATKFETGLPLLPSVTASYALCPTVPNVPKCGFTGACSKHFTFLGLAVSGSSTTEGPVTTRLVEFSFESEIGNPTSLTCRLELTPVVNGVVTILAARDSLHRSRCGNTRGSWFRPMRLKVDADVALTVRLSGLASANTTSCDYSKVTLACVPIPAGSLAAAVGAELCLSGVPRLEFSSRAAEAVAAEFTVNFKGTGHLLVGGAVTTELQASGFDDATLPTNVIAFTHQRSWSSEDEEIESFSGTRFDDEAEMCHVFYDAPNTGDALSLAAKEDRTTVKASAAVATGNNTNCSDAQFDAWECYRYQRFSMAGGSTTTSGVVRYHPTQFAMDFSVTLPNVTDLAAAFDAFADTVRVGISPTLDLNAKLFHGLTSQEGTVSFNTGTVWATRGAATVRNGRLVTAAFTVCYGGEMSVATEFETGIPVWPSVTAEYILCPTLPEIAQCTFTECTASVSLLGKTIYIATASAGSTVGPTHPLMVLVGLLVFVWGHR